jgi:hypothetical protein
LPPFIGFLLNLYDPEPHQPCDLGQSRGDSVRFRQQTMLGSLQKFNAVFLEAKFRCANPVQSKPLAILCPNAGRNEIMKHSTQPHFRLRSAYLLFARSPELISHQR